ncbi:nitrogenase component 1 [Clostridium pasteurianum]|uniref:nitrogenase component 1 n=1 Tax=Clostridium pasteurianum TaxID=1501 RepID=UPI002260A817|nr:nitrogenase component 1 [Clostridium pasteurianum]UZW16196.1 nitrogenase component 1 [Clostridium pasteurianum]
MSVKDSYVLLHTTIGCNWGTSIFHMPSNLNDIRQSSTVIYNEDVIFGGLKILKKAIDNVIEMYNPKILFVISGCVSGILVEDFEVEIKNHFKSRKIVYIKAPGFVLNMEEGQVQGIKSMIDLMKYEKKTEKSINIIGLLSDDYMVRGDINNIRNMLGDKISINSIIPFDTIENIEKVPCAELNVVFKGFETIGDLMQKKFNIPYVVVQYPYGFESSKNFIRKVFSFFNLKYEDVLKQAEKFTVLTLKNVYDYIRHLYSVPCAVFGDTLRAAALKNFLEDELGMDVQVYYECKNKNMNEFRKLVKNSDTVILFGSSFEREISEELGISFIRYVYPVFDSVSIGNRGYAGFEGVINLLEDLINSFMTMKYRRHRQYI